MLRPYVAPMLDEVGLLARAEEIVQNTPQAVPDRAALHTLTQAHGIDLATAIFYHSILASPQHGLFVAAVDAERATPSRSATR